MAEPTEKDREEARTIAGHVGLEDHLALTTAIAQALATARAEGAAEERERLKAVIDALETIQSIRSRGPAPERRVGHAQEAEMAGFAVSPHDDEPAPVEFPHVPEGPDREDEGFELPAIPKERPPGLCPGCDRFRCACFPAHLKPDPVDTAPERPTCGAGGSKLAPHKRCERESGHLGAHACGSTMWRHDERGPAPEKPKCTCAASAEPDFNDIHHERCPLREKPSPADPDPDLPYSHVPGKVVAKYRATRVDEEAHVDPVRFSADDVRALKTCALRGAALAGMPASAAELFQEMFAALEKSNGR